MANKLKTYTIDNYPYFELKVTEHPSNVMEIAQIEYDKKGKVKERGFVMLSAFACKKIKDALVSNDEVTA